MEKDLRERIEKLTVGQVGLTWLVDDMRNGPWVDYELARKEYNEYAPELSKMISTWLKYDETIKGDLRSAGRVNRKELCKT